MENQLLSDDVLKKLITPNAKALSSPKGDRMVSENRGGGYDYDPDPNSFNDDFSDDLYLGSTLRDDISANLPSGYMNEAMAKKIRDNTDYSNTIFTPENVKGSKLNSAILQEMVTHPIDTSALNTSKLESANGDAATNNAKLNKMLSGAKRIEESLGNPIKTTPQRVIEGGSAPIDYALIKTIVNECLETKLKEMSERGLLNEGTTLKGIGLSQGKIKIVDNKGNVFSAELEKVGNVKDKNKGEK